MEQKTPVFSNNPEDFSMSDLISHLDEFVCWVRYERKDGTTKEVVASRNEAFFPPNTAALADHDQIMVGNILYRDLESDTWGTLNYSRVKDFAITDTVDDYLMRSRAA
jgi:hypothetical protein